MRKTSLIALLPLLTSCLTDSSSTIYGSYCRCIKDGEYQEHRISKDRIMFIGSRFPNEIYLMSNLVQGDTLIVSGLNFELMFESDTLMVANKTKTSITLKNQFGDFELKRLNLEIPELDSTDLESSTNEILAGFNNRALIADCPDLRTEEEKNPDVPLGIVDDDYEDIIDELP